MVVVVDVIVIVAAKMPKKARGSTLKSALLSQQAQQQRQAHLAKRVEADQRKRASVHGGHRNQVHAKTKTQAVDEERAHATPKGKGKGKERRTYPFDSDDHILLIGEGNFSFALALLQEPHNHRANLLVATAFDSEIDCYAKYPDAEANVTLLQSLGCRVEFNVDATDLQKTAKAILRDHPRGFERIVFNFPHAGAGIKDQDRNVLVNQKLMLGFYKSAAGVLSQGEPRSVQGLQKRRKGNDGDDDDEEDVNDREVILSDVDEDGDATIRSSAPKQGTLLVTLKNSLPYTLWDVPKLATRPPANSLNPRYRLLRSFAFHPDLYPGYSHRRTIGWREGKSKSENEELLSGSGGLRTWEFALSPSTRDAGD